MKEKMQRTALVALLVGVALVGIDAAPAVAQSRDQIAGKTCRQLLRSCMRICTRHYGEPAWKGCQADCNIGNTSCKKTGEWRSKNATVTVQRK